MRRARREVAGEKAARRHEIHSSIVEEIRDERVRAPLATTVSARTFDPPGWP